jgi:hypothetical protein
MMRPLPHTNDSTHNGDKLLPLKERLTTAQQFTRREKIMAKGTRMEQMGEALGRTQQALMGGFGATNTRWAWHMKRHYTVEGVLVLAVLILYGRMFGWW